MYKVFGRSLATLAITSRLPTLFFKYVSGMKVIVSREPAAHNGAFSMKFQLPVNCYASKIEG